MPIELLIPTESLALTLAEEERNRKLAIVGIISETRVCDDGKVILTVKA
jgi:hypothetical protein